MPSVHDEKKKPYKCEHCHEAFDEEEDKVILNQFMRGRNLMNVNIATKDLMKIKTSNVILYQFMRGRNLMNENIAMKYLTKRNQHVTNM